VCDYARRKYYIGYWKALVTKRYPQRIVSDSHTPQVLKAQIGAVATMAPLGLLSLAAVSVGRLRWAWKLLAAVVALFLALIVPFQIKLIRRSPVIGVVAPILLIIRALALGCGYLVGTLRFGSGEPSTRNRKSED
jgi:O-antigen ligase